MVGGQPTRRQSDDSRGTRPLFTPCFPIHPWRDRGRVNPETDLPGPCIVFELFKIRISGGILSIPPTPACTKQNVMEDISSTEMMAS